MVHLLPSNPGGACFQGRPNWNRNKPGARIAPPLIGAEREYPPTRIIIETPFRATRNEQKP